MSFVRPEATAQLRRWREVLIGAALWLPGLWWALLGNGLIVYVGIALLLGGASLMAIGYQRGRFRVAGDGPGFVEVSEGEVSYFGPLTGGSVALPDLARLSLDGTGHPPHWILSQPGRPDLYVPTTAEGAETLFDAFAALPGLRIEHMLARLRQPTRDITVIWRAKDDTSPPRLG